MFGFNIVNVIVVSQKRPAQDPYVQPRSRKITSKIGIGIPSSQSRMYPVAAACLILFAKRIDWELFLVQRNFASTNVNIQSGWWMVA